MKCGCAVQTLQTTVRKYNHQKTFQRLKTVVLMIQPWYRGCKERKLHQLHHRKKAIHTIQNSYRVYKAIQRKEKKEWAINIIHQWIVDFTWIQPIVEINRIRTTVVIPEQQNELMLQVYEAIANRRNAGQLIVHHLRTGYIRAKGQHGYVRASNQIQVRHAAATVINQTVWTWVCHVKMKRAFQPLLALQCIKTWMRKTRKLTSIKQRRLISNVAATKIQRVGRGHVVRRHRTEHSSVTALQAWYRCVSTWRKYRVQLHSVVQITKVQRALKARSKYWWIASKPGKHRSRMFEQQSKKIAYPQREGHHSNPPVGHYVLGHNHVFVETQDYHEHDRMKLRMFLPTK